jgi:hypothetical protein
MALVGGAVPWPLAVRAQQSNQARRIGALMGPDESDPEAQFANHGVPTRAPRPWVDRRP